MLHHRTTDIAIRVHHIALHRAEKALKVNGDSVWYFSVYDSVYRETLVEFQSLNQVEREAVKNENSQREGHLQRHVA